MDLRAAGVRPSRRLSPPLCVVQALASTVLAPGANRWPPRSSRGLDLDPVATEVSLFYLECVGVVLRGGCRHGLRQSRRQPMIPHGSSARVTSLDWLLSVAVMPVDYFVAGRFTDPSWGTAGVLWVGATAMALPLTLTQRFQPSASASSR